MLDPLSLLGVLADGRFHSGARLAAHAGVSRMTVCNAIRRLSDMGLEIDALRGRGYRLRRPVELLERETILGLVGAAVRPRIARLDVHPRIDSTNSALLREAAAGAASGTVCLAEAQSAGRGRRGRGWVSPFGANLYLSLLWRFAHCPVEIAGLGLLVALALARGLRGLGAEGVGVKWPNDLVHGGRKLGGILTEMSGEVGGRCHVVVGVGINVALSPAQGHAIDQPWTDLKQILGDDHPSRNVLAAAVIEAMVTTVRSFESRGLKGLAEDWRGLDAVAGRAVRITTAHGDFEGVAAGVDGLGRLRLMRSGTVQVFDSGDVSLWVSP